jgi:hypothetical protein
MPTPEHLAFEIMRLQSFDVGDSARHLKLAKEVQDFVHRDSLRPVLRTVYHRTAFQRSDSNDVRISFDAPCYFVKETPVRALPPRRPLTCTVGLPRSQWRTVAPSHGAAGGLTPASLPPSLLRCHFFAGRRGFLG